MTFASAHALVVGVGKYQHISQYDVPLAARDAQAVSRVLQDPARCAYPPGQVRLLTGEQATRAALIEALDGLAAQLTPADTLFFFYVGHGVYDTQGKYTLTTHETQLEGIRAAPGSGLSELELIDRLRKMKAKRLLLVINACHSGELSQSFDVTSPALFSEAPPAKLSEALLSTGEGRITITACRPEQQSWIGGGELSLFTGALVNGLMGEAPNNRGYISAFGLYEYLYFGSRDAAAALQPSRVQEPELTVLKGVGPFPVALYRGASAGGDFDVAEPVPAETRAREVSPERSQRTLNNYLLNLTRDGAIAQGPGAKAVGKGGVMLDIGGDVSGNIVIGNNNEINNKI